MAIINNEVGGNRRRQGGTWEAIFILDVGDVAVVIDDTVVVVAIVVVVMDRPLRYCGVFEVAVVSDGSLSACVRIGNLAALCDDVVWVDAFRAS